MPKTKKRRIRPIHTRIALHASSLLLVLGGGFVPFPLQHVGQSYTIDVSAKVSAPLPPSAAIITSPHDGEHVGNPIITVTGSCPADSYVKVTVDGHVAGVSICSGGEFDVQATLSPGANNVSAQVYNTTDDAGPSSSPITVYYDEPAAPAPAPTSQPTQSPTASPSGSASGGEVASGGGLTLDIPYHFMVKNTGDEWEWVATIGGGVAPYRLTIDWGDGTVETFTRSDQEPLPLHHKYARQGTYQPLITVHDSAGNGASLQLVSEVRERPTPVIQFFNSIFGDLAPALTWPAYALAIIGVGIFWVLEIRAFRRHITQKPRARHRHA